MNNKSKLHGIRHRPGSRSGRGVRSAAGHMASWLAIGVAIGNRDRQRHVRARDRRIVRTKCEEIHARTSEQLRSPKRS